MIWVIVYFTICINSFAIDYVLMRRRITKESWTACFKDVFVTVCPLLNTVSAINELWRTSGGFNAKRFYGL